MLEIFSGSGNLSYACYQSGHRVGQPIDLETGFDLMTQEGRNLVWDIIVQQKPKVIFLAPPCTAWSQMQNINDPAVVYQKRLASVPLLNFCFQVAEYQSKHGRYFFFENPSTSNIWETKQFKAIY